MCAKLGEEFYYFTDESDLLYKLGIMDRSNTSILS